MADANPQAFLLAIKGILMSFFEGSDIVGEGGGGKCTEKAKKELKQEDAEEEEHPQNNQDHDSCENQEIGVRDNGELEPRGFAKVLQDLDLMLKNKHAKVEGVKFSDTTVVDEEKPYEILLEINEVLLEAFKFKSSHVCDEEISQITSTIQLLKKLIGCSKDEQQCVESTKMLIVDPIFFALCIYNQIRKLFEDEESEETDEEGENEESDAPEETDVESEEVEEDTDLESEVEEETNVESEEVEEETDLESEVEEETDLESEEETESEESELEEETDVDSDDVVFETEESESESESEWEAEVNVGAGYSSKAYAILQWRNTKKCHRCTKFRRFKNHWNNNHQ